MDEQTKWFLEPESTPGEDVPCLMPPSGSISCYFADFIHQALGSCHCSPAYNCCVHKYPSRGWAVITSPIFCGVWMILFSFLADLLETPQIGISVDGGHLLPRGYFGLTHSHLLMQCTHINQRMYRTGLRGDSGQGVTHADLLGTVDGKEAATAHCPPVPPSSNSSCSGANIWIWLCSDSPRALVPIPLLTISTIYF